MVCCSTGSYIYGRDMPSNGGVRIVDSKRGMPYHGRMKVPVDWGTFDMGKVGAFPVLLSKKTQLKYKRKNKPIFKELHQICKKGLHKSDT